MPRAGWWLVAALALTCCTVVLAAEDWNFEPPRRTSQLHFWHHSTGAAWLDNGLREALRQVEWDEDGTMHRSYMVSDYGYGGQNDYTYYVHWYKRFRTEMGIEGDDGENYVFHAPETAENRIPADGFMLTCYDYRRQQGDTISPPQRIEIIMFKPCYPGSQVWSFDTSYDADGHVTGGTPWSDSGHRFTNWDYLDSVRGVGEDYTDEYWPATDGVPHSGGAWPSGTGGATSSLAQVKVAYRGMLAIFHERPEVLFIAVQAPPQVSLTAEQRAASRELARWFREDWLHEYDPTGRDEFQDYRDRDGRINVVCFDYYDTLAYTGDDPVLDAAYGWFPDGWDFPDDFMDWEAPHRYVEPGLGDDRPLTPADAWDNRPENPEREIGESRKEGGDSHPSSQQHYHATDVFVGLQRNPDSQGYRSFVNAVTNRWLDHGRITIRLEKAGDDVLLRWGSEPDASYGVHGGEDPTDLPVLDTVPAGGEETTWTDGAPSGAIRYYEVTRP